MLTCSPIVAAPLGLGFAFCNAPDHLQAVPRKGFDAMDGDMRQIVTVDIGGTHARFAVAELSTDGQIALCDVVVLQTREHASLKSAWAAFAKILGRPLPRAAGIAIASPVQGDVLQLTNNPWIIRPSLLQHELELDCVTLINDFEAVAHAVAHAEPHHFQHVQGPTDFPPEGVTTVIGPGSGLGVAALVRANGRTQVVATEGGHVDFAPLDTLEDYILARLRKRFRRVSVERVASGPGLANILDALASFEGQAVPLRTDKELWQVALAGTDSLSAAALDRFCMILGAVAGDTALVQGANRVVIAGGVGLRLKDYLGRSGFGHRFTAKGRFETMMKSITVEVITHPQAGLFGAAAAFSTEQHN